MQVLNKPWFCFGFGQTKQAFKIYNSKNLEVTNKSTHIIVLKQHWIVMWNKIIHTA